MAFVRLQDYSVCNGEEWEGATKKEWIERLNSNILYKPTKHYCKVSNSKVTILVRTLNDESHLPHQRCDHRANIEQAPASVDKQSAAQIRQILPRFGNLVVFSGAIATAPWEAHLFLFREVPLVHTLGFLGFLVFAVLHGIINMAQHCLDGIRLGKVQR